MHPYTSLLCHLALRLGVNFAFGAEERDEVSGYKTIERFEASDRLVSYKM